MSKASRQGAGSKRNRSARKGLGGVGSVVRTARFRALALSTERGRPSVSASFGVSGRFASESAAQVWDGGAFEDGSALQHARRIVMRDDDMVLPGSMVAWLPAALCDCGFLTGRTLSLREGDDGFPSLEPSGCDDVFIFGEDGCTCGALREYLSGGTFGGEVEKGIEDLVRAGVML